MNAITPKIKKTAGISSGYKCCSQEQ